MLESQELSREVRVSADGTIGLPLLAERIRVSGLSLGDAEELIGLRYREAGILNDPNITITLKEIQSKPVTVMGAVRSPGVFQVGGQSHLLRILTQAGGLTEEAGEAVQILRKSADGRTEVIRILMPDITAGRPEADLPVYGGDTVNVLPAAGVYVVGAVNKPGRYAIGAGGQQLTVLRLLALSEDLKRTARPSQAVIIRKDASRCPNGECTIESMQQIQVDIGKILRKQQPDVALQHDDVLFVPDSLGKRALTRGLEAALQLAVAVAVIGAR